MTLLTVVKDVCAVVGVTIPAAVIPALTGNRTMQEMLALANEMAQRIAYDNREWSVLKQKLTLTGDGVADAFSLPADYKRMLMTASLWRSTSPQQPMMFVPDTDVWHNRRAGNASNAPWGEWTMYGGQIHVWPIMAGPVAGLGGQPAVPAVTAYTTYISKNCVRLQSGGAGDRFMSDADTFRLDERLLTLGMIWQWKASKGAAYAEDLGTYADALSFISGADSPAPVIIGRRPISSYAKVEVPSQTIYFPGATP